MPPEHDPTFTNPRQGLSVLILVVLALGSLVLFFVRASAVATDIDRKMAAVAAQVQQADLKAPVIGCTLSASGLALQHADGRVTRLPPGWTPQAIACTAPGGLLVRLDYGGGQERTLLVRGDRSVLTSRLPLLDPEGKNALPGSSLTRQTLSTWGAALLQTAVALFVVLKILGTLQRRYWKTFWTDLEASGEQGSAQAPAGTTAAQRTTPAQHPADPASGGPASPPLPPGVLLERHLAEHQALPGVSTLQGELRDLIATRARLPGADAEADAALGDQVTRLSQDLDALLRREREAVKVEVLADLKAPPRTRY